MSELSYESMLDVFVFETAQLLEQLEQIIITGEKSNYYSSNDVNEIFRITHTIKGSSAMMQYTGISALSHSVEDLFYFIRETNPPLINFSALTDLILKSVDFIKTELAAIEEGKDPKTDPGTIVDENSAFLCDLKKINSPSKQGFTVNEYESPAGKQKYCRDKGSLPDEDVNHAFRAVIHFDEDCKMENVRAFAIVHSIRDVANDIYYSPPNIVDNVQSADIIRNTGFELLFKTDCDMDTVREILAQTVFINKLSLKALDNGEINQIVKQTESALIQISPAVMQSGCTMQGASKTVNQSMISVNISKLDKLMNIMGELVISEAMLTQNPDLKDIVLENFSKAARQHKKITDELHDTVMSIRMTPISATFQKMNRILRDMCKKLDKNVRLEITGEETEIDKNIVDHISDPLMHIIRNAIDHGIEPVDERITQHKDGQGTITLQAKKAGGNVLIIVRDDGKGLDKQKIIKKATENALINRPVKDLKDSEIFSLIFLPGFSTNDRVSEFSGRGVGMDVVTKNIRSIGGEVFVDSVPGKGTTVTIQVPLTLAIMNGMIIRVGKSVYTIPLSSIREFFKLKDEDIITDPDGNEMTMIRGECYPVLRLYEIYKVNTKIKDVSDGIIALVESEGKTLCVFADELIGEQQVVVKPLPGYIKSFNRAKGVAGCTLLGDGSISLILDVSALINSCNEKEMKAW